ncbi:MAG TPA: Glu/Leu/Phe/Val dehydrogenase dimerization domain-containing protein [Thermoleophilaceae bacterium]|nr:Glu/Leu/Phe/Val dehydrogenase dimerization domain-containing protein [Thermoleophilaceae bacterium]
MSIVSERVARGSASLLDDDHEQIVVRQDHETGLRLVIAIHSTVLGPSLGGMRLKRYPGGLREGLADVMALARTMTLKASAAGLPLGGGKAVMLDDGRREMHERRLVKAAEVIEELGGAYITAEDIGTSTADMDLMARHTRFAVGRSVEGGGGGDPSPITAETVFQAIGRGLEAVGGSSDLEGRRVGVIGLGKVGYVLGSRLAGAGAEVIACDLDLDRAERLAAEHGAHVAPSAEAVMGMGLDVLAPCAAGGMIDDAIAGSIHCKVVAGAANNPLTSRAVARTLMDRGILYVPDFLANCGGLIHVSTEWHGERGPDAGHCVARAMERLEQAIVTAEAEGRTPIEVAERQALERVEAARVERLAAA